MYCKQGTTCQEVCNVGQKQLNTKHYKSREMVLRLVQPIPKPKYSGNQNMLQLTANLIMHKVLLATVTRRSGVLLLVLHIQDCNFEVC